MSRTFGEWFFLVCIWIFYILQVINPFVAFAGLFGGIDLGGQNGFDTIIIIITMMCGILFVWEVTCILLRLSKREKILGSLLFNVFALVIKLIWVLFAVLLFYDLYGQGNLMASEYSTAYLIIAIVLILTNTPFVLFHGILCSEKWRKQVLEISEQFNEKIQKNN